MWFRKPQGLVEPSLLSGYYNNLLNHVELSIRYYNYACTIESHHIRSYHVMEFASSLVDQSSCISNIVSEP